MREVPLAKDTQQKHVRSPYRGMSCPCIVAGVPLAGREAEHDHLPRTHSAVFHSKQSHCPYNQTHNRQQSPNLQTFFTPAPDVITTYDVKSSEALKQISAVCGCCDCSCGPCGPGCCSLPPPCNTAPKCSQCMTGYYYYPYGNWFCGPYNVKAACSGGPVSPGGPCGPNPPSPGGPCGPCASCCCLPVDMAVGKAGGTCFTGLGPIASCNCAAPSSAAQYMGMYYMQGTPQSDSVVCQCNPSLAAVASRHMNNPKNLNLQPNQNPPTNNNSPRNQNRPIVVPSSGNSKLVPSSTNPWAYCGGYLPLSPPCRTSRYFKTSPFCSCRSCCARCNTSCGPFGPYGPCGPCGISCGACGPCRTLCGPCGCSYKPCGYGNCRYSGCNPCNCGSFGCYGSRPFGCCASGPCSSCGYNNCCCPFGYGSCGCKSSGCGPCRYSPYGCGPCGCKPWCGPFFNCCLTPTPVSVRPDAQFNVCDHNVMSFPSLSCSSSTPPLGNLSFVPTRGFSSDHPCVPSPSATVHRQPTPNISQAASYLSASITLSGGESYYPTKINPKFIRTFPFERQRAHHKRTSCFDTLNRNYSLDSKAKSFKDVEDYRKVEVLLCTYSYCRAVTAPKDKKISTKNETVERKSLHDWSLYNHPEPKSDYVFSRSTPVKNV